VEPFAALVNAKLRISDIQNIFIYVHDYKVVFENPIGLASDCDRNLLGSYPSDGLLSIEGLSRKSD
jgi:hypothetical protein